MSSSSSTETPFTFTADEEEPLSCFLRAENIVCIHIADEEQSSCLPFYAQKASFAFIVYEEQPSVLPVCAQKNIFGIHCVRIMTLTRFDFAF